MTKIIGTILLSISAAGIASAAAAVNVPEIDSNSAVAALALLSGATLVIRGRRNK